MTAPVLKLDSLIASKKVRTGNEGFIYYNLGAALLLGRAVCIDDSSSVYVKEVSCAVDRVNPTGGTLVLRAARIESLTDLVCTMGITSAPEITVPLDSPIGASFESGSPLPDVDTYVGPSITGGAPGDTIEVWALPDPANDVLICYDRGFSAKTGSQLKPVPRKLNPVDHYVNQRPDNTLTISELTVNNWVGLRKLRGRIVTIIVKLFPDSAGLPCEIQYYTRTQFSGGFDLPADGNDFVNNSLEGTFNKDLIFAAPVA